MSKVLIVYFSGTGNTEIMAEKIADGLKLAGSEFELKFVEDANPEDVNDYEKIMLGCPSMGDEVLEEELFEPFFSDIKGIITDKKIALFGSYGWGEGKWMRDWEERVKNAGAKLFEEGLIINETPDSEGEKQCEEFGAKFSSF